MTSLRFAFIVLFLLVGCDSEEVDPPPPPQDSRDTTPPSVMITAPPSSTTVSGTIAVECVAEDRAPDGITPSGIQYHELLVDGTLILTSSASQGCSFSWDSSTVTDGVHVLNVRARDLNNNVTTSDPVTVIVEDGLNFTRVYVTEVRLEAARYTNASGEPWDFSSLPDFFFTMEENAGTRLIESQVVNDYPESSLPIIWSFGSGTQVPNWETQYTLVLREQDDTGAELVGTTPLFKMQDLVRDGYPDERVYTGSAGIRFKVSYRWE